MKLNEKFKRAFDVSLTLYMITGLAMLLIAQAKQTSLLVLILSNDTLTTQVFKVFLALGSCTVFTLLAWLIEEIRE